MLKEKIQQDTIASLKAQEKEKLEVLRFLSSQIKNAEIEKGKQELKDEEIVKLISGQIKKLQEALTIFAKGKRDDLVKKNEREIKILSTYLPQQLNDEELAREIDKIFTQNPNLTNPGALIGICVKTLSGKADNQRIAQIVQKKFNQQPKNNLK